MASKEEMSRIGRSNVNRSKSHERRVSALLEEWSGIEFRRRRVEGRDATVVERETTADVIPVRGAVHFSIEAKCGAMPSLDGLLANPSTNLFTKHWHQTCYDADLLTKVFSRQVYPMLFFKPHANFDWIAIAAEPFVKRILQPIDKAIPATIPVWFSHFLFPIYEMLGPISHNISHTKNKKNKVFVPLSLYSPLICRWRDFAAAVDSKTFFLQE